MTLDSLDVKQMKLFLALLEERNLTRVASKLCVSQQAVSEQLKKLRQAFNDKLFVRARNGVVPTPFANELGSVLRGVVNQLEEMGDHKTFDPSRVAKSFVIAASEYAQLVLLDELARVLRAKSPQIQLTITTLEPHSLEKAMAQGQIDIVIGEEYQAPGGLPQSKLFTDQYVCVENKRPANTPSASTLANSFDSAPETKHMVLTQTQTRLDRLVAQWLSSSKFNQYTALSVPSYSITPQFIEAYDAVALLPSRLLPDRRLNVIASDQRLPSFELVMAWHPRNEQDPLLLWIKQCINDICTKKDPNTLSATA